MPRSSADTDPRSLGDAKHPIQPEADYRRHLAAGRFMLQRSCGDGGFVHYPRVAQPGSGATDLEWVEASGPGSVYSTTTVRRSRRHWTTTSR